MWRCILATDKRVKLNCPFCGAPACTIQVIKVGSNYSEIRCPRQGCEAKITGSSNQDVISRWNRRV